MDPDVKQRVLSAIAEAFGVAIYDVGYTKPVPGFERSLDFEIEQKDVGFHAAA